MGEMKIEHVLLFLVGAFLVYHMMGKCGRVEGMQDCSNCTNPFASCLMPSGVCAAAATAGICNNKGGTWCSDHVDTSGGHMTECNPHWSREECLGPKDPHFRGSCFWNTQDWPYSGWCDTDRGH